MGHGASKTGSGTELRPGMKLIQMKIEEVMRRVRVRKSSITPTSELLRPEEHEGLVNDDSARSTAAMLEKEEERAGSPETIADAASEEKMKEEKMIDAEVKVATKAVEEQEKRELGFREAAAEEEEEDDDNGRRLGSLTAYAELPGSPSFRFYCTDLARDSDDEDDDSVKFGAGGRCQADQLPQLKEEKITHESEIKSLKKNKGSRLKVLTKVPSRMYSKLNIRNCYINHSATTDQDTTSLLNEKDTS